MSKLDLILSMAACVGMLFLFGVETNPKLLRFAGFMVTGLLAFALYTLWDMANVLKDVAKFLEELDG